MAGSQWTPVDFSGCTLSSNDQNVIVILSLWAVITSSSNGEEINIQSLEELVYAYIVVMTLCSLSLWVFKVQYVVWWTHPLRSHLSICASDCELSYDYM